MLFLSPRLALRGAWLAALLGTGMAEARELHSLDGTWNFQFGNEPAREVTVPHTWNAEDAAGGVGQPEAKGSVDATGYRRGAGTYTRKLALDPKPGKRYFIRSEGASIVAELSVNGQKAGRHEGAFTAFCHEITPFLKPGANTVTFRIDNSYNDNIPPLRGDFNMPGGLYRSVQLIETDSVCISPVFFASPGVAVNTKSLTKSKAEIEITTVLNAAKPAGGQPAPVSVTATVLDRNGKEVARDAKTVTVGSEANLPVAQQVTIRRPRLWQGTEDPYLYAVKVTIRTPDGQTDEVAEPLGLRTYSIDPEKGFVLNGKTMQIRGVNRHQDRPGKSWAISAEDEEEDVRLIRSMGATGIRTAHYPVTKRFYDLCDREGLVIWSEVSCVNEVRQNDAFQNNMRSQAEEMVRQHGNHPSICFWGIYNEINGPKMMEDVLIGLNDFVKKLDPDRITVAASNMPGSKRLNKIPQNIAFNNYSGWYGGGPEQMGGYLDARRKDHAAQGIAISEYGHGASIRQHENPVKQPSPKGKWHPEEWQTRGHEANYRAIKERPFVWGSFVWNMFDFAAIARTEGDTPGMNDKGLVTYDRKTPKDAFFFYKANWNPAPMVYITSRRFRERTAAEVPVKVYSNASEVKLSVNGKSCGTVKTDDLKRAVWPAVKLQPGDNVITAAARVNGKAVKDSCTWTLKQPSGKAASPERYEAPVPTAK